MSERSPSPMLLHHGIVARPSTASRPSTAGSHVLERSSSVASLGPGFGITPKSRPSVSRLLAREDRLDALGLRPRFAAKIERAPPVGTYNFSTVCSKGAGLAGNSLRSFAYSRPSTSISISPAAVAHPLWDLRPQGRSTRSSSGWDRAAGWQVHRGARATMDDAASPPPLPRFASTIPYDPDTAEIKSRMGLTRGISLTSLEVGAARTPPRSASTSRLPGRAFAYTDAGEYRHWA